MTFKNRITRTVFYSYISIVGVFALIRMLSMFKVLQFSLAGDILVNMFIQIGVIFAIPVFIFSFRQKEKVKDTFKFFGYKKIGLKAIGIAILLGVVVYILNIFVSNFFANILVALGYKYKTGGTSSYPLWLLFVNLFCSAVLPAICEETAHRGLLLKGLSPLGKRKAIIISSLLFGLAHMNIQQFFYATLIGLLLGYIASCCDSIYPCMIIHFMNNALSTFMSYSYKNGLGLNFITGFLDNMLKTKPVIAVIFSLALIVLMGLLLYILVKQLFKCTVAKRTAILQEEIFKELAKNTYLMELQEVADGNTNLPSQRNVSFEEFDEIYRRKGVELGYFTEFESKLMLDNQPYKMDAVTKTLMATCFILSGLITIFTFIWGVL